MISDYVGQEANVHSSFDMHIPVCMLFVPGEWMLRFALSLLLLPPSNKLAH